MNNFIGSSVIIEENKSWAELLIAPILDNPRIISTNQDKKNYIYIKPYFFRQDINVTERMTMKEWNHISQPILSRINRLRCITNNQLEILCKLLFQYKFQKTEHCYVINNQISVVHNNSIQWHDAKHNEHGTDIASLYSYLTEKSYVDAVDTIFNYLETNKIFEDSKPKKGIGDWVSELNPITLDPIPPPWLFYPPIVMSGANVFNYIKNGHLVAYSFSMPRHEDYHLTAHFTLMRHKKTCALNWFPIFFPELNLFFHEALVAETDVNISFVPDEYVASEVYSIVPDFNQNYGIPLACPGGLEQLLNMDVSIASQKHVHIFLTHVLAQNSDLIFKLEQKFSESKSRTLTLYNCEEQWDLPIRKTELPLKSEQVSIPNGVGSISKAGEKIPGADITRKKVLAPIIETGQLVWIYGPEKSGKSWLARSMAHVISYGREFLGKYRAASGLKVLYIDSEMAPDKLEQAFRKELMGLGFSDGRQFDVKPARASDNPSGEINLLTEEWRIFFEKNMPEYDVIFLDCYYSLTASSVMPKDLLKLLTPWKNKGKTFIIVDHTNKEGDLQGGADKKRAADLCIELKLKENQCVEVSFPTARYLGIEDTNPFLLRMLFADDSFCFEMIESNTDFKLELAKNKQRYILTYVWVKKNKFSPVELAKNLNYSKSSVYVWGQKIEASLTQKDVSAAVQSQIDLYEKMDKGDLCKEAQKLAKK